MSGFGCLGRACLAWYNSDFGFCYPGPACLETPWCRVPRKTEVGAIAVSADHACSAWFSNPSYPFCSQPPRLAEAMGTDEAAESIRRPNWHRYDSRFRHWWREPVRKDSKLRCWSDG